MPYSGTRPADGDMPSVGQRYELRELKEVTEHVYVYPVNSMEVETVNVDDPGNSRYIWKLPKGVESKYSIWDRFSQKDVAMVDLDS